MHLFAIELDTKNSHQDTNIEVRGNKAIKTPLGLIRFNDHILLHFIIL